ncbi:MAG: hypothetical protein LUQ65_06900 [Candidatus Helarchaeota archaeon]|nr:hypothetical protein [Candidatus Helarchaeota archaeon]
MTQNWNCSKKFVGPLVIISFLICAVFLGSMYVIRPLTAGTDQSEKLQVSADTSPYSLEWTRTWDIENDDKIWDMVITANSTYYLAGTSTGGTIQAWLAKFHSNGTQLWNKTWSTGGAYGLAEDSSDHSLYLCGSFPNNTCLIKYNSTGSMLWNYTFGGLGTFQATDVAIDKSTNSIYLVGWTNGPEEGYLIKLAANGSVLWGYEKGQYNSGVTIDSHDNVIFVTRGIHEDDIDLAVGKYASNGTCMWYYLWGRHEYGANEEAFEVAVDSNDNIYVVGYQEPLLSSDKGAALIMKFDSNGNSMWNRTWGSPTDVAYGVQVVGTAIYVAGFHDTLPGSTDLMLLKYNSLGQLQWNLTWDASQRDVAYCLSKDHQNNLYIGGWTNGTNYDALILKFKASVTDGTDGIPGFQFSFALIPLVFLLGYVALRYRISFFSGKRRI